MHAVVRAIIAAANLPRQRPKRWTPRRKAMVVAAVQSGIIDMDTACEKYDMWGEGFLCLAIRLA